jgi:glycosyltransferase involved in cell wall biosynthesis
VQAEIMGTSVKPRIVVSGVNFVEAGPLSIFRDALQELSSNFSDRYEIIALVHSRDLFEIPHITVLEFPGVKPFWLRRLWFEYWQCLSLSRLWNPILWLAMHDMTPNVEASIRAVYCHNPAPFYRSTLREALLSWKSGLFAHFYRYLYAINLKQNQFVVVQQEWLRKEFRRRYKVSKIIVAHPSLPHLAFPSSVAPTISTTSLSFFYPAYPRIFKNIELVLESAKILEERGIRNFELWLTLDGKEDRYSAKLFAMYGHLRNVRWLGSMSREDVMGLYRQANFLLFPSKLETWGMPLSEFKETGKPILAADLPYAHETIGTYNAVHFFSPENAEALADDITGCLNGTLTFGRTEASPIASPFAQNWTQLFQILLGETSDANS